MIVPGTVSLDRDLRAHHEWVSSKLAEIERKLDALDALVRQLVSR